MRPWWGGREGVVGAGKGPGLPDRGVCMENSDEQDAGRGKLMRESVRALTRGLFKGSTETSTISESMETLLVFRVKTPFINFDLGSAACCFKDLAASMGV